MPRLLGGASCHRPCGGGLRGGGLSFISVPSVVVCLTLYTLSSQIANQDNTDTTKTIANTSIRRRVATTRRRHKDDGRHSHGRAAPRPQPRRDHDGHGHDHIQRNVPARYHTTRPNTIEQTFQCCTMQQTPPWGSVLPAQKARPLAL